MPCFHFSIKQAQKDNAVITYTYNYVIPYRNIPTYGKWEKQIQIKKKKAAMNDIAGNKKIIIWTKLGKPKGKEINKRWKVHYGDKDG